MRNFKNIYFEKHLRTAASVITVGISNYNYTRYLELFALLNKYLGPAANN